MFKKSSSGYHEIRTILQEIPQIYDSIKIINLKESDHTSIVHGTNYHGSKEAIQKNNNLAHKALLLLKKTYKIKKFAQVVIKKNIPVSSGLGGASSDAAAVLKGLNKLWNLKISTKKLLSLAAKIGMDVPFFILGGTALATHFGEKITALPSLKNVKFKIFPKSSKSATAPVTKTASAYAALDLSLCGKNIAKTNALLKALKAKTLSKKAMQKVLATTLHNDFETLSIYKNLQPHHHLSGSGPSTFTT